MYSEGLMSAAKKIKFSKDWMTQSNSKKTVDRSRQIHRFEQMRVTRSEDLPELMTVHEAAEFLGRHFKTVEEYRKEGALKFFKMRGRYFTTPEFLAEFIEAETRKK